jgi:hypothetical protein
MRKRDLCCWAYAGRDVAYSIAWRATIEESPYHSWFDVCFY